MEKGMLRQLVDELSTGVISRRTFLNRATALGVTSGAALVVANAVGVSAKNGFRNGFAVYQGADGTPAASPVADAPGQPAVNTENQTRGEGGELKLIQWQAPTLLSPHVSSGTKDFLAAQLVIEPLIHYDASATMLPNLLSELPSVENGHLAEDLTSVELHLLPDVMWSDGEPFTSADVGFTIDWVQNEDNNSVNFGTYASIKGWEIIDDLTIRVDFVAANPFWFDPFAGTATGNVYPKHILEVEGAHDSFVTKPIGTGPYVVDSFTPNDEVRYVANENYREVNKPYFASVMLKGGGDAAAAARAVIQTGEFDYAWNLALEPDVLTQMESEDAPGEILDVQGISVTVERINFNFSDPDTEVDGQRSEMNTPHPFLTDDAVRRAIVLGVNREQMVKNFYGEDQQIATNIVYGDEAVISKNTVYEYDPEKAKQTLEEAGWVDNGSGMREKDGVALDVVFATSVNAVRQKIQSVVKANLEEIGFRIQLETYDAGIYFDAGEGNDTNIYKFYWDFNLYQSLPNSPRSMSYMEAWYSGPDGNNIAQASNAWNGSNTQRWQNEEYDAAYEAALVEIDPEKLTELFVQMNDLVINNDVVLPIVLANNPRGISKRLNRENIARAAFSYDYWNIANWNWNPES
jgi:peptide/nickel transport system substrate-binding protein